LRKLLGNAPFELRSHYVRKNLRPLVIIGYNLNPRVWDGPYINPEYIAKLAAPWSNEYRYVSPGTRSSRAFEVWSIGGDGVDGTDDDIGSWMDYFPYKNSSPQR
jgi:hypothetical protein